MNALRKLAVIDCGTNTFNLRVVEMGAKGGWIPVFGQRVPVKLGKGGVAKGVIQPDQRVALDEFEVEGIGHNLPFLSAVYDHERFTSGKITTAFIAEESENLDISATSEAEEKAAIIAAALATQLKEEAGVASAPASAGPQDLWSWADRGFPWS